MTVTCAACGYVYDGGRSGARMCPHCINRGSDLLDQLFPLPAPDEPMVISPETAAYIEFLLADTPPQVH